MLTSIPKHWQRQGLGIYYDPLANCMRVVGYELVESLGWPLTAANQARAIRILREVLAKERPGDRCVEGEGIELPGPPAD